MNNKVSAGLTAAIALPVLLLALACHSPQFLAAALLHHVLAAGIGLLWFQRHVQRAPSVAPMQPLRNARKDHRLHVSSLEEDAADMDKAA